MIVLGIDSATTGCSAAVRAGDSILAHTADTMTRGQAERLVPMIRDTMAAAGLAFQELDRIAVTIGPGAFTGVRIALAAARGLALGCGAATVGITTFDAVFAGLDGNERAGRNVLIGVDSRRDEPFLQLYDEDGTLHGEPAMLLPEAVAGWVPSGPLLVAGDGAAVLRHALAARPDTVFSSADGLPDARVIAALGAQRPVGPAPEPAYLRPPDVTVSRRATA